MFPNQIRCVQVWVTSILELDPYKCLGPKLNFSPFDADYVLVFE